MKRKWCELIAIAAILAVEAMMLLVIVAMLKELGLEVHIL